jgi:outer membrane protein assembly factor BamA
MRPLLILVLLCVPQLTVTAVEKSDFSIFVLPLIYYTPETTLAGGGIANALYRGGAWKFGLNTAVATLNQQYTLEVQADVSWAERLRTGVQLQTSNYPDLFYGIGNQTRRQDEESYLHRFVYLYSWFEWPVLPTVFAGIHHEFEYSRNSDFQKDGLLLAGVPGREGGIDSGLGVGLTWDRRDHPLLPTRGVFTSIDATWFLPLWGSTTAFSRYSLDLRAYLPLWASSVLASQLYLSQTMGEVPFHMLSLLGGRNLMRGVYLGRFRDDGMVVVQVEYRQPLIWRFSSALFVGLGQVAPVVSQITVSGFRLAGGAGIRFSADNEERINLRLDIAWSENTPALYLTIFEAF